MNRFKSWKNLIFLIISGILLISTVIALPSLAWVTTVFTVRKDTELTLDGSSIASTAFDAYKYISEDGLAKRVTGDDITLPLYDSVFTEKNENSTLIYRIPVFGDEIINGTPFKISLNLQNLSDKTGLDDNNFLDGNKTSGIPSDAIADYVSNIIYLKCAVIESLQSTNITVPSGGTFKSEDDYIYSVAHEYFKGSGIERHTFVEMQENNDTISFSKPNNLIEFTIEDYTSQMASGSSVLYVFIEIGYDNDLVDHMTATRNASYAFDSNDQGLPIESDLDSFVFTIISGN